MLYPYAYAQNYWSQDPEVQQEANNYFTEATEDFNHYYDPQYDNKQASNSDKSFNWYGYSNENPNQDEAAEGKHDQTFNKKDSKQNEAHVSKEQVLPNTSKTLNKAKNSYKQANDCYKKFAVGSYMHLLNEPVVNPIKNNEVANDRETEPTRIKKNDSKSELNKKSPNNQENVFNKNQTSTNITSEIVEKIASNVKSNGQQKWKNSTKSTSASK